MGVVTTLRIPLPQRLDTYIANALDFNLFFRTVSESPQALQTSSSFSQPESRDTSNKSNKGPTRSQTSP